MYLHLRALRCRRAWHKPWQTALHQARPWSGYATHLPAWRFVQNKPSIDWRQCQQIQSYWTSYRTAWSLLWLNRRQIPHRRNNLPSHVLIRALLRRTRAISVPPVRIALAQTTILQPRRIPAHRFPSASHWRLMTVSDSGSNPRPCQTLSATQLQSPAK